MGHEPASVCAVAVAYQNPEELVRLLASVVEQTLPPMGLIVVDNSEESDFILRNRAIFERFKAKIPYTHRMVPEKNGGSAAGFKIGMARAHLEGFDWAWLLDQDGCADAVCLENLARRMREAEVLCPRSVSIEDWETELPFRGRINIWNNFYQVYSNGRDKRVSIFGTHGVLIGRKAMDETGYYDDRNFFCGWEDYDYSQRLHRNRLRMLMVGDAIVYHPYLAVKYKRTKQGKLPWTSRLYIWLNPLLPLPMFLGAVTLGNSSVEAVRERTLSNYFRKHIRGWRFAASLVFSLLCLPLVKLKRPAVSIPKTLRMYREMLRAL